MVRRLRHLDHPAEVADCLALGDRLLGGFELPDDLLGCVPGGFYGEVSGPVWPDEDSHSLWTALWAPRQHDMPRSFSKSTDSGECIFAALMYWYQDDTEVCPFGR